ncbi:MAG: hypothetical protein MUP70_00345, partial [Candidatus Aminicenantes bacterium]|nr:hypothetical protein [Candidatus Aminicenantes bacterium]
MVINSNRRHRRGIPFLLLGAGLLLCLLSSACREYEMRSGWLDRAVGIDGETGDWVGQLAFVEEEMVSIGMMNDGSHLYICLISENRGRRAQILQQGMTIWFGKEKASGKLGLRFPLGMESLRSGLGEERPGQRSPEGRPGEASANRTEKRLPELPPELLAKIFSAVEIFVPTAENPIRLSVDELTGIEIGLDRKSDIFSYEIKIPLSRSENIPYGIDVRPGETILVDIEVPKMEMGAGSGERGARDPMGGGMGGGRGGMGGGGGMRG